jgi:protein-L-isoaspartate(D-aspartate) O-methyltransferase
MIDYATARRHMVDGQVRTADVTDLRILAAMQEVPRERFVPPQSAPLAYLDLDIDLDVGVGSGKANRRLLKPMMLAKLIQAAAIDPSDRVLDVGCATGYTAAVLGRVGGQIIALEERPELAQAARAELASLPNVSVVAGPLVAGWAQSAPYDVIILEGAAELLPEAILRQLGDGGRLLCISASGPGGKAMLYRRSGNEVGGRAIFDASAPFIPGVEKAPVFSF